MECFLGVYTGRHEAHEQWPTLPADYRHIYQQKASLMKDNLQKQNIVYYMPRVSNLHDNITNGYRTSLTRAHEQMKLERSLGIGNQLTQEEHVDSILFQN